MISQRLMYLRSRLQSLGLSSGEVSSMMESASSEIQQATYSIVEKAVYEAEDYGSSIGAEEFLAQIKLDASSGYIEISTDSGQTDFSQPPLPMLPWLLNKAKTAKDGSRYKVIPVGGVSSKPKPTPQARDIASGLNSMSSEVAPASAMAESMAAAFGLGASASITERQRPVSVEKPEFRTASSKQDASRQWVLPAKDLDMTGTLMTINATIRSEIDRTCDEIINKYEMEAKKWRG
jgi:hypothetical protein